MATSSRRSTGAWGRILDAVDRLGLAENTLVMFTSDNGPWWDKNEEGGTSGQLRGAKGDTFEGGMRVPFSMSAASILKS